jgi:hypothetical protein
LGGEGPVPYYYKTPGLCSLVNGIFGIVYLSLTFIVIWALLANKRRAGFSAFSGIIGTIIMMYLNGQIPPW